MACLSALVGALFATSAFAHMQLHYPPPFNATNNPHRTTNPDPYLQYPYDCCGPGARWEYPCRGYLSLLDTPEGAPTATWEVGSTQTWNITGIGNHYGGSCQVGFSTDKGETFRVATSYEGNCPHRNNGDGPEGQNFYFFVPEDLETGIQVFAWIWHNREQEFNMNCAAVNITARIASPDYPPAASSMSTVTVPAVTTWVTVTANSEMQTSAGITQSGSASSSASSSTLASSTSAEAPGPDADSQTLYQTANGCSCICKTPVQIETCSCYCHQDDDDPSPSQHPRHLHRGVHEHGTTTASVPEGQPAPVWVPFNELPLMFIADDGNGCLTPWKTAELKYPNPGPHTQPGDGAYTLELPSGNCSGVGGQAYHG